VSHENRVNFNHQICEEAAGWFVEFNTADPDTEQRLAFDAWIRASPEHLRAFIEVAALWHDVAPVARSWTSDTEALIARARAEAAIVTLSAQHAVERERPMRRWPRWSLAAAALVGVIAATGASVAWHRFHDQPAYATTQLAEQHSIRLEDGSTVVLNARSRVRVDFTRELRTVELLEGQALFQVTRSVDRPFIVRSGDTWVRALGTQFDIDRKRDGTVVTVLEGRVGVVNDPSIARTSAGTLLASAGPDRRNREDTSDPHRWILLSAGEQLRVVAGKAARTARTDAASASAWTQGRLVFESASLAEVAEEFNRYSARKLVVEDQGATPLHLSGVFATDPDFLIRYLRDRPDIEIRDSATEIDIVRRAPK
jgi:transmembrane sensor